MFIQQCAAQLAALVHAIASYGSWDPGKRFLYDFVTQSDPKLGTWTASEAAHVLWSLARLRWVVEWLHVGVVVMRAMQSALIWTPALWMRRHMCCGCWLTFGGC